MTSGPILESLRSTGYDGWSSVKSNTSHGFQQALPLNENSVILSGFSDEASLRKTAVEQFSAFAAMGLRYCTLHFVDVGNGIKNVMNLLPAEIKKLCDLKSEYGLQVASIGSPIGKVKLLEVNDESQNRFVPFEAYLEEVKTACSRAHAFETRLLRGFSFYPPQDDEPDAHLDAATERIGRIADICKNEGLVFGLEVEANLVGRTGDLLAEIHKRINSEHLKLIFDAANLLVQGFSVDETIAQYRAMKPGLGWVHIKDYKPVKRDHAAYVDEGRSATSSR